MNNYKVVIPFYVYAALAFLAATALLFFSAADFSVHYFHPHVLAITHIMVLGWGTMIVLGASHQLVPVLIESTLYSNRMAWCSFIFAAIGIPFLAYGFYVFNMGWPAQLGGSFVIVSILSFCINLVKSITKSKQENVHAVYLVTASLWLLCTAAVGLLLVCNFTQPVLPAGSVAYLSLHAHMGIAGWFLLLIIGVGSRLIPMFLISKYNNPKTLWQIYYLINTGLLLFIVMYLDGVQTWLWLIPILPVATALVLFAGYCYSCYQQRIRKKVDEQMKISLLSVLLILVPLMVLAVFLAGIAGVPGMPVQLITTYGFLVIFGWITAIILGMTFKTLPFIVWNKYYHDNAASATTPNPKDLFSDGIFKWMSVCYLAGSFVFVGGILIRQLVVLQTGAALLLLAAVLYNRNVLKVLMHKPIL